MVWDDANRKHLGLDHPERQISLDEITQAMTDPTREEARHPSRAAVWVTKGRTAPAAFSTWPGSRSLKGAIRSTPTRSGGTDDDSKYG